MPTENSILIFIHKYLQIYIYIFNFFFYLFSNNNILGYQIIFIDEYCLLYYMHIKSNTINKYIKNFIDQN